VKVYFPGAAPIVTVPSTALVREGTTLHVYVQHTPERFEFREVRTRRTFGDAVEITGGLKEGDRVVVRGAEQMPRP
jgi:multidrug efflux pump subunit AcrA (membrane-fusion protein)